MPQTPKPRVLPRVTYNPPVEEPTASGQAGNPSWQTGIYNGLNQWGANTSGIIDAFITGKDPMLSGKLFDGYAVRNYGDPKYGVRETPPLFGQAGGSVGYQEGDNPFAQFPNGEQAWADYQAGKYANNEPASQAPQPTGMDSRQEDTADARAARIQQARASSINRQIDENTKATDAARASGDTEALARLQREWEQLKASPVYQQFFGNANENELKSALVNIYMKPDRANAATSLADAAVLKAKDDIWGDEARMAGVLTGDPQRDKVLWDEHYYAMNFGGRDPLDGHPQAVQNIQARARDLQNANNASSYDTYSGWLTGN